MKKKGKLSFDEFYTNNPDYYNNPSDGLINCLNDFKIKTGKALDIGCGQGRNSIWLAKNGYIVDAFDTAVNAIANLDKFASKNNLSINAFVENICNYNIEKDNYDLIVAQTTLNHINHSYLSKICSSLEQALRVGGVVYVICFTEEDPAYTGEFQGISECSKYVQYFFKKNELLHMFNNLHILHYTEYVKLDTSHGQAHYHGKAKLFAQKKQ